MWKKLFGRTPVRVWIIKQIDRDLLHLCGEGRLDTGRKADAVLAELSEGHYQGPVQMGDGGLILNARLFAALVPHDGLHLGADGQAHWRGHNWRVARVPQRCWAYEGRLVPQMTPQGRLHLTSTEDLSGIRRRADSERAAPGTVHFRAANELEDEAAFSERQQRRRARPAPHREWRGDDHGGR